VLGDPSRSSAQQRARRARAGGGARRGRRVGSERAAGRRSGCGCALGQDEIAPGGGRREHALVSELVGAWGWHERAQALDEGERIERDSRRAVTPVALQAIDVAAVRCEREAPRGDRRPSHIATETLEPLELAGGHEHVGVQREAVDVCAQRTGRRRALGRERGAALDRHSAELVEERRLALVRLVSVSRSVRAGRATLALRDSWSELARISHQQADRAPRIGAGEGCRLTSIAGTLLRGSFKKAASCTSFSRLSLVHVRRARAALTTRFPCGEPRFDLWSRPWLGCRAPLPWAPTPAPPRKLARRVSYPRSVENRE